MTRAAFILLSSLLAGCATGPWKDFYGDQRDAAIPGDVRKFVIEAQGCGHFSGEDPYDAERAAFLKKNVDELCTGLREKRAKLLAKYPADDAAKFLIAEVWEIFGEN